jgi:UDP-GlcNAc:undecaprenyl-phosphate GlcNAc-1-phosphate transferase
LSIELHLLLAFLIPLTVSFVITGLMVRWAPVLGLIDVPNERKVHTKPVPKGGGLGIFIGWLSAALLLTLEAKKLWVVDSKELWVWGGIGLIIVVLGLIDDVRPLPWQWRLGVQFITAIACVWLFAEMRLFRSSTLPYYILWPAAVFWIVGLTNAFNMLDNMDMLSGGVAWVVAALFFDPFLFFLFSKSLTLRPSDLVIPIAVLPLIGALTGFFWFNRFPARIFMGDAGSTFLGFFFGTSSLLFAGYFLDTGHATNQWQIFSGFLSGLVIFDSGPWGLILCLLAIPWYDLVSVVTIRLSQGRSPFHADKQHLSHRLVALGLTPPQAVGTICLLATIVGAGGLLIYVLLDHGWILCLPFVVGFWVILAVIEFLLRKKRRIGGKSP